MLAPELSAQVRPKLFLKNILEVLLFTGPEPIVIEFCALFPLSVTV